MSNPLDCTLDVLAVNPKEIHDIANALQDPVKELLDGNVERPDKREVTWLHQVVAFHLVGNNGFLHENSTQARFENSSTMKFQGLIRGHLRHVSTAFPTAIFLVEWRDMQWSWSCKEVIRNGVIERSVWDGDQRAQAIDWMLLDIFAPFRVEYDRGQPFGSMWNNWVCDLVAAANKLRNHATETKDDS